MERVWQSEKRSGSALILGYISFPVLRSVHVNNYTLPLARRSSVAIVTRASGIAEVCFIKIGEVSRHVKKEEEQRKIHLVIQNIYCTRD